MKKEEKIEKVKDLLNQVLILCGKNQDEFLSKVRETLEDLLKEDESKDDYSSSEDYYDSTCSWDSEDSDSEED